MEVAFIHSISDSILVHPSEFQLHSLLHCHISLFFLSLFSSHKHKYSHIVVFYLLTFASYQVLVFVVVIYIQNTPASAFFLFCRLSLRIWPALIKSTIAGTNTHSYLSYIFSFSLLLQVQSSLMMPSWLKVI